MKTKARLFVILWLGGMAGVSSLLLIDFPELLAHLPVPEGTRIPTFTPALQLLSLVQPAVLMSLAVLIGVALASKVGLSSPVAEAMAGAGPMRAALTPQIIPGLCGGLTGGAAIVLTALLSRPFLPTEVTARIARLGQLLPFPTRLLYGGIMEELLLRWGLMTLLVWVSWRLFQKEQSTPKDVHFVGAIVISSLVFGIGHLPIAFLLVPEVTAALAAFVIVANSVFGLIAGYLYWKKGLESAIIAHMLAHVVLLTASRFGMYF